MNPHLFILTGASRGMGLAMARQLLQAEHTLLCISRKTNETLAAQARLAGTTLLQWAQDLAEGAEVSARLEQWLREQAGVGFASAVLINNAGMIPRIAPLSDADADELRQTLAVGLEAPMQLSAAFLRATESWTAQRKVLNISSGLGRKPMASQAPYCAAKAGLDHFTRCLALEEALKPRGAAVCSLAPGVIDTDMQVQMRGAEASAFPDVETFANLKNSGRLSSPEEAARNVLAYLQRPDFGAQPVE
jgi:NAD(P)-dependent dehydrogenase (short-subunit alcohol dehydrogenase family)